MKILIYGAGVIGSVYASLLSQAGYETSVYARGKRLEDLQKNGLRVKSGRSVRKINIHILSEVLDDDIYDFIFLPVRENQLEQALSELKGNHSPTIITLVNTISPYDALELLCGKGRLLPAFPGAGGSINDGVLDAALTPGFIQPTTFGEIDGRHTERAEALAGIFKKSGIPYQIVSNMHYWQISHLGLIVPMADAYYMAEDPKKVYLDADIMRRAAKRIKTNFRWLARRQMLAPAKFHLMMHIPDFIFIALLKAVYKSDFGDTFMYRHAMKAPGEMKLLHDQLYSLMKTTQQ